MNYYLRRQREDGSMFRKYQHSASLSCREQHISFSFVTSFSSLFTEKSREYNRVLRMAITSSAKDCILSYVAQHR